MNDLEGEAEQRPAPTVAAYPLGPGLASVAPVEIPKRRLHPLTPLLESFRLLMVVVLASSWQMYIQENGRIALVIVILAGGFGAVSGLLSWLFTGYRVVGGELQIAEGVLIRKSRTLPLERLQGIEVAQPLRARLFGLAQLRIEVAGASETEAPLSYLRIGEARELREELLAIAGRGARAEAGEAEDDEAAEPGPPIAHVPTKRLIIGSALEALPANVLVFGIIFAVMVGGNAALQASGVETEVWIAAAPILFGLASSLIQTISSILRDWNFTLSRADGRLRVERGLTEKSSNIVPLQRVTAVSMDLPVMWRPKRWRRVQVSTASLAQQSAEAMLRGNGLLPVGTVDEAVRVAETALPGIAWSEVESVLTRPPRRARWRTPLSWRVRGAGLGGAFFAVRSGLLKTTTVAVPYARIQQVQVKQGPLQRLQRLATVRARTVGSLEQNAVAVHRDEAEAVALAAELRARADAAAAAEEPRLS
ncbi:PH domain-containing protein [Glycomyces salinus]|uniref:PH domain-containing protein n=1 Tax=Glycomyces salinus TaxID=980294 RepID=UPI0018EBFF60|nr:PH domain-containing protein [Glycomyces salinus]